MIVQVPVTPCPAEEDKLYERAPMSLNEMEWSAIPSFKGAMARPTISTNREAGTGNHNGESHGMTSASNWSKNVGGS